MPDCIQPVKSRSESRSSMFRVEQQSEDSSQQTGSRYRKKSASSKRAKNKRNTFSELQIPTVSDNGATRNRMASYNRQIIVHSDMQSYSMMDERDLSTEYFCPQLPQKTYNDPYDYQDRGNSLLYDNMRTFRQGYLKKDVIWHSDYASTFKPRTRYVWKENSSSYMTYCRRYSWPFAIADPSLSPSDFLFTFYTFFTYEVL